MLLHWEMGKKNLNSFRKASYPSLSVIDNKHFSKKIGENMEKMASTLLSPKQSRNNECVLHNLVTAKFAK